MKIGLNDLNRTPLTLLGAEDHVFSKGAFPRRFVFDQKVAAVFDDMVSRSIPLYKEINHSILEWAHNFALEKTNLYDIGCSTGTTLKLLNTSIKKDIDYIGIDTSGPMLAKAAEKIGSSDRVRFLKANALDVEYNNASFVILNFTLQFIPVSRRQQLLQKIYDGMRPGAILFIGEKVRSDDPLFQEMITCSYEDFKIRNGYSKSEIERKKEALDDVLIPFTLKEEQELLTQVGFRHSEVVIKWNNFLALIAQK